LPDSFLLTYRGGRTTWGKLESLVLSKRFPGKKASRTPARTKDLERKKGILETVAWKGEEGIQEEKASGVSLSNRRGGLVAGDRKPQRVHRALKSRGKDSLLAEGGRRKKKLYRVDRRASPNNGL